MKKQWKLLAKGEIKSLSKEDLKDYLLWLDQYKKEKSEELSAKKEILVKMQKEEDFKKREEQVKNDEEEIKKNREELKKV